MMKKLFSMLIIDTEFSQSCLIMLSYPVSHSHMEIKEMLDINIIMVQLFIHSIMKD